MDLMEPNRLIVVAEVGAKAGKEDELRRALLALIEPTRREEGCVQYDLHVSTEEAGRFVFFEIWVSKEALDRHMQTAHFRKFVAAVETLLAEPPRVLTYTRIS